MTSSAIKRRFQRLIDPSPSTSQSRSPPSTPSRPSSPAQSNQPEANSSTPSIRPASTGRGDGPRYIASRPSAPPSISSSSLPEVVEDPQRDERSSTACSSETTGIDASTITSSQSEGTVDTSINPETSFTSIESGSLSPGHRIVSYREEDHLSSSPAIDSSPSSKPTPSTTMPIPHPIPSSEVSFSLSLPDTSPISGLPITIKTDHPLPMGQPKSLEGQSLPDAYPIPNLAKPHPNTRTQTEGTNEPLLSRSHSQRLRPSTASAPASHQAMRFDEAGRGSMPHSTSDPIGLDKDGTSGNVNGSGIGTGSEHPDRSRTGNGSGSTGGASHRISSFFGGGAGDGGGGGGLLHPAHDRDRTLGRPKRQLAPGALSPQYLRPYPDTSSNPAVDSSSTHVGLSSSLTHVDLRGSAASPSKPSLNPLNKQRSGLRNRPSTAPTASSTGMGMSRAVSPFGFGSLRAGRGTQGGPGENGPGSAVFKSGSVGFAGGMSKSASTPMQLDLRSTGSGSEGRNTGLPRSTSVGYQRTFADDDTFGAGPASPLALGGAVDKNKYGQGKGQGNGSGLPMITRHPLPLSAAVRVGRVLDGQGMYTQGQARSRSSAYVSTGEPGRQEKVKGVGVEDTAASTDGERYAPRSIGGRTGGFEDPVGSYGTRQEPRPRTRSESGQLKLDSGSSDRRDFLATYPIVTKDTSLLPMPTIAPLFNAPEEPEIVSPPAGLSFPATRRARSRRFSWEINRAVVDGKEFLGFGSNGEVGRVRLRDNVEGNITDEDGNAGVMGLASSYIVGYEREALLHQAVYEICDNRHSLFPSDLPAPRRILDLGTGLGLWPIAMSQIWKDSRFVGMDIAPIQTDLKPLAKVQALLRNKSRAGEAQGDDSEVAPPDWELAERNIQWRIGDILDTLPFPANSFDLVHVRFAGLGIPENRYPDFIDEISRVLVKGTGVLEIIEMSYVMPLSTTPGMRNSYSTLLLSNFLQQTPHVQIRADLTTSGLKFDEVVCKTYPRAGISADHPSHVLANAIVPWADSATGKGRHGRSKGMTDASKTIGLPAFEARILAEMSADGEGTKQNLPRASDIPVSHSAPSSEAQPLGGEDDVVLLGWIARKK